MYTSTDLALLATVADKVSGELLRFDQLKMLRQARRMQESLRRYVPGALVEHLKSGDDLREGEREVTVFFVDIRGYATLTEGLEPAEIFSTVNRYTTLVSELVRKSGGSVVEFNGDGMMAVFGAPDELQHKERAAVRAARQVVAGVHSLAEDGSSPVQVGVGIATGDAYVGNVQAVDRLIWTAVGNTTNLAARLQEMTRELDASVVMDARTQRVAGPAARAFQRLEQVAIRGRTQPEELWLLPLVPATSPS